MKRLYLLTLEIAPLEIGRAYDELPSHLTLMSRFLSAMAPEGLVSKLQPLFAETTPIHLIFSETTRLGPKKITAHMVNSPDERGLHNSLCKLLDATRAEHLYPEFIGDNHKPHVTEREGAYFEPDSEIITSAVYLIEVVDKQRVARAKFALGVA